MKKIFSLTSIFTIALFYSQSKIDSLLKKYNTQKNIEKVETGTKIGQYYKEDSLIHRLDPRVKLFAVLIYVITLFMHKAPATYVMSLLFLIIMILKIC